MIDVVAEYRDAKSRLRAKVEAEKQARTQSAVDCFGDLYRQMLAIGESRKAERGDYDREFYCVPWEHGNKPPVLRYCDFRCFSKGDESWVEQEVCCDWLRLPEFDGILSDPSKQDAFLRLLISELVK